ncbi:N-acetylmuramoyl-L-alanine amidase [Candidatus Sumerlaeota bacterium]|nr:N-acetylmuramoyl-L-alanine amidase [Candidatus Sumerlaeota bacterium]
MAAPAEALLVSKSSIPINRPTLLILALPFAIRAISLSADRPRSNHATPVICIDPGHSKASVGARGKNCAEYQICWKMSDELRRILEREGAKVVLTKQTEDEDVPTRERAEIANRAHADLFIRLHCDAAKDSGVATYYPSREGKVMELEKRENGNEPKRSTAPRPPASAFRGPDREVIEASGKCARKFHKAMIRSLGGALRDRGLRTDLDTAVGKKQGALTGSVFSRVPVLLVEMGVITNPKDEAFLASEAGRAKLARAITDGIREALK